MPESTEQAVSVSAEGKRLLTAAKRSSGVTFGELARQVGARPPTVRALIYDEEDIGKGTPTWSSHLIPGICKALDVPLWQVVSGLTPDQRRLVAAFEELRTIDPERYRSFFEQAIEIAGDKVAHALFERQAGD